MSSFKVCPRCKLEHHVTHFYRRKNQPDGLSVECKPCTNATLAEYRAKADERRRAYALDYNRKNARRLQKVRHAWNAAHPRRDLARGAVWRALKSGEVTRPDTCQECGTACRPDAHHHDYGRPLDVIWLCRKCHKAWDRARLEIEESYISIPNPTSAQLAQLRAGDHLYFAEQKKVYTVVSNDGNVIVCDKPLNVQKRKIVTTINLRGGFRIVHGKRKDTRLPLSVTRAAFYGNPNIEQSEAA